MIETVTGIVRNKDLLSAEVNYVTTAKLSEVALVVFDDVTAIEQTRESDEGTVENATIELAVLKDPLCSETALFNFTCKRYGQFDELFSSRSTFSLPPPFFFSLFFSSLAPFSPPRLIFSLSLPLDGATFHPSPRSSFRCKVHTRTRLGGKGAHFFSFMICSSL